MPDPIKNPTDPIIDSPVDVIPPKTISGEEISAAVIKPLNSKGVFMSADSTNHLDPAILLTITIEESFDGINFKHLCSATRPGGVQVDITDAVSKDLYSDLQFDPHSTHLRSKIFVSKNSLLTGCKATFY